MIRPVEFPEVTSNQINTALVADKLNELIRDYNKRFPDPEPANAFARILPEDLQGRYEVKPDLTPYLKPGVKTTKNGKYYIPGKGFIKASEAYL